MSPEQGPALAIEATALGRDRRLGFAARIGGFRLRAVAFTTALNDRLLIAAIVALAGGLLALALVRGSDFVTHGGGDAAAA